MTSPFPPIRKAASHRNNQGRRGSPERRRRLREHLSIGRWLVFGGSWGSTLALAYAQAHSGRVTELVLRGIYLVRPSDEAWSLTDTGAAHLFPAEWAAFRDAIPATERHDLITAYGRRIGDPDPAIRLPAAHAWMDWELAANTLLPVEPPKLDDAAILTFARITHHYISNGGFLPEEGLLAGIDRIRHIPAVIVNGRYDMKTPPDQAWDLHLAWPEAEFHIVEDAGHGGSEPGNPSPSDRRHRSLPQEGVAVGSFRAVIRSPALTCSRSRLALQLFGVAMYR